MTEKRQNILKIKSRLLFFTHFQQKHKIEINRNVFPSVNTYC